MGQWIPGGTLAPAPQAWWTSPSQRQSPHRWTPSHAGSQKTSCPEPVGDSAGQGQGPGGSEDSEPLTPGRGGASHPPQPLSHPPHQETCCASRGHCPYPQPLCSGAAEDVTPRGEHTRGPFSPLGVRVWVQVPLRLSPRPRPLSLEEALVLTPQGSKWAQVGQGTSPGSFSQGSSAPACARVWPVCPYLYVATSRLRDILRCASCCRPSRTWAI